MTNQKWNSEQYARTARFVSDLGEPVLDLLAPQSGERVLDLGCGDGALTARLMAAGCKVVGVDGSQEQIDAARARGVDARVEVAEALPFENEFDAVFSNAVLHWIENQPAVLGGVHRALRSDGRFVAELGGFGCVDAIRRALHDGLARRGLDPERLDPWFFPTEAQYDELLRDSGFSVESMVLFPRPTPLPSDVSDWLETFARPFLAGVEESERGALIEETREALRPQLFEPTGSWVADYVRLRFVARKQATA